nr:hypothetical protein [uncultured Albidiferax sp.]
MVPISGRLPDDLYSWLAAIQLEGATTVSDKLRVAVVHLKRMHDGDTDYLGALSMYRDLGRGTRELVAQLERQTGQHSEVLASLMEHIPVLVAALNVAPLASVEEARQLEATLVKRTMQMAETLLRQAVTAQAAAYDPLVVSKNAGRLLELARLIPPSN